MRVWREVWLFGSSAAVAVAIYFAVTAAHIPVELMLALVWAVSYYELRRLNSEITRQRERLSNHMLGDDHETVTSPHHHP